MQRAITLPIPLGWCHLLIALEDMQNVKGIKTKEKEAMFWTFVHDHLEVFFWAIQEPHLSVGLWKKSRYLVFDADLGFSSAFLWFIEI